MVKRSTIILLIVLALAVAAYFLISNRSRSSTTSTPTSLGSSFLITEADGTLQSLRIEDDKGNVVQLQRDPSNVWVLTEPIPGEVDQSLAGAAETQVGALRIVTVLETTPELSTIKLDQPVYTIDLKFTSGAQHKIEVGEATPTGSGYYVHYDDGKIYVISQSGIDALANLLASPPYLPTPTPTDTPIASPTPTLEMTATSSTLTPATMTPTP